MTLLLLALTPSAQAQDDEDAALALARRLLGPWGDGGGLRVELTPRGLPEGIPVELPLPDELDLLGSLANYGADGELVHTQIVLDSPLPPDDTLALLEQSFNRAGWSVQQQGQPVGFTPVNAHVSALYCAPEDLAFIHMNSFGTAEGFTDVRLELNTQVVYSPCSGEQRIDQPLDIPLPKLAAPPGSEITLHGGTYLEEQASSSAVVFTDMSADELQRHFEEQLERAGWLRAPGGQSGASVWTRLEEERRWRAVLSVIDLGGARPQFYAAFVMVPAL
ncbi:MAG TPA: hypothetical protein VF168_12625 [Trueperaceae bacterium]